MMRGATSSLLKMQRQTVIRQAVPLAAGILMLLAMAVAGSAWADTLDVWITSPEPSTPVFGEVVIEVDILGRDDPEIAEVQFFVDGQSVGVLKRPPWRWSHDVGGANRVHRFEVVAVAKDGERASALLESTRIRVDDEVDLALRQLYVTVSRGDVRIKGLDREQFEVRDNGKRQEIVTFEGGDVPLTAAVLVDASDSMRGERLRSALTGADQMFQRLGPLDRAKLLLFSDRIVHSTPFTSFSEVLRAGLRGVEAGGGTALDDHLYLALHELEAQQGRRVVVLLSDGIDISSFLRMEEVLELALRSRSLVYWMRLGPSRERHRIFSAWRGEDEHREELELLDQMVRQTGGRIVPLKSVGGIGEAFDLVMDELRDQYVLGYYPSSRMGRGARHTLKVGVDARGLDVRARESYVED